MKNRRGNKKFTKNDLLKLKTRRLIYQCILKDPGVHFREICRRLNLSRGTVTYHTAYLEKRGLITVKHSSRYAVYYTTDKYGTEEKNLLHNIKFDTARYILFYLVIWGIASQVELSKELKKHQTTIEFNIKKLIDLDLIEQAPTAKDTIYLNTKNPIFIKRNKIGREMFYRIKSPVRTSDLLVMYHGKKYYNGDIADAFSYLAEYIFDRDAVVYPHKLNTIKQSMESIEDRLFDIFPHPYYC